MNGMLGTLVAALAIIVVGTRSSDALRTAQLRSILTRLPEEEAAAYYQQLRRQIRKVALLRAVALAAMLALVWALRHR